MAVEGVYSPTTTPNPKSSCFNVPSDLLTIPRFALKVLEVVLSFLSFLLEELVSSCMSCAALYFFEFSSCTSFLFTVLLLVLLASPLHRHLQIPFCPQLDFLFTCSMAALLLCASVVFATNNNTTSLELSAVAFGFLVVPVYALDAFLLWRQRGSSLLRLGGAEPNSADGTTGNNATEAEHLSAQD